MAVRPVFVPSIRPGPLVEVVPVEFEWFPGLAPIQKTRSIESLHIAARRLGMYPLLEVSTKSPQELGRRLSAFSLKLEVSGAMYHLESVYQSSKVFSESGQHDELMCLDPYSAKKKIRELGRGQIVEFRCFGRSFPTEPKNAFYDWLYVRAIFPHREWISKHVDYYGYTDIEFNPERSINCQARAVAEFMCLEMRGSSGSCFEDFFAFRSLLQLAQRAE